MPLIERYQEQSSEDQAISQVKLKVSHKVEVGGFEKLSLLTRSKYSVPQSSIEGLKYRLAEKLKELEGKEKRGIIKVGERVADEFGRIFAKKEFEVNRILSGFRFRVVVGQITDSTRDIGMIEVLDKEKDKVVLGPYLVKHPHGYKEVAATLKRIGKPNPGPETLYGDDAIIVEELVPFSINLQGRNVGTSIRDRGLYLTNNEFEILGDRMARAVYEQYRMGLLWEIGYTPGRDPGRILDTHIKLINQGNDLRVIFLDWSNAVDTEELMNKGRVDEADNAIKEHIMMLLGVVHRCIDDGPDAKVWASFENSLLAHYARTPGGEGLYFHRLLMSIREEVINPQTWGGDENIAEDWHRFFEMVDRVKQGIPVERKPTEDRERHIRDLSTRNISPHHGEAIVDFLSTITDRAVFKGLNFRLEERSGEVARGYGVLHVMGPEPEREEIAKIEISPLKSEKEREDAALAVRASNTKFGPPVLHVDENSMVRIIEKPNIETKIEEMKKWEDAETAFRSLGKKMAGMLSQIIWRGMIMDRSREEIVNSMAITGDNVGNINIILTEWKDWVRADTRAEKSPVRDKYLKEFIGAVGEVAKKAGEMGKFLWYEFETELPRRAKRRERREMYQRIIEEYKREASSDPKLLRLFREASQVEPAKEKIPEEIEKAMLNCGIKNISRAWRRLRNMGSYSDKWVDVQDISEEEIEDIKKRHYKEFEDIAPKLLDSIHKSGVEPEKAIRTLEEIGNIYENASAVVYSKHLIGGERKGAIGDKLEIYRLASENPEVVKALTDRRAHNLAGSLSLRAAYLTKIMIELIAERPDLLEEIVDIERIVRRLPRKGMEEFREELKVYLNEVEVKAKKEGLTKTNVENVELIHDRKVKALKTFTYLNFLRLGYMYTEKMEGRLKDTTVKDIYEEVSNLSLSVLEGIYSIEREYLTALYGEPSSKFAMVLGGASSRREFPSFDYDALAVVEKYGKTAGGIKGEISNIEFFNKLYEQMETTAFEVNHHLDRKFVVEDLLCATPDYYEFRLKKDLANNPAAMLGLENLSYGCGDKELADKMIEVGWGLIRRHALISAASSILLREKRDREWDKRQPNIKYTKGGLRDLLEVMVVYKVMKGMPQKNIFDILGALPLSKRQRAQLLYSYLWLMNIRIRLDLEYGRQHKFLPEREEDMRRFAKLLGYRDDKQTAVDAFMGDYYKHTSRVREITNDLLSKIMEEHPELREEVEKLREYSMKKQREERVRREREAMKEARMHLQRKLKELGAKEDDPWAIRKAIILLREEGIDVEGLV